MNKYLLVNQMTSSFVLHGEPTHKNSEGKHEPDETKCLWNTEPSKMIPLLPDQAKDMANKKFMVKVYEEYEVEVKNGVAVILTNI